ncbi:MAG: lipopolysaccharide N-acetylglucosaminyl transferase [Burkholderiaceae bacterium]
MILAKKLFVSAATVEAAALAMLNQTAVSQEDVLRLLTLHALASAIMAWALLATLPKALRRPRGPVFCLLYLQNFFVPGLAPMLRAAHALGERFRKLLDDAPVETIGEPQYAVYRDDQGNSARDGRVRTKLTDLSVPSADRLTALLALQETPARASADLLRQLLADPVEDIRLLAYGMLDGKEKKLSTRILAEEGLLEQATRDEQRLGCRKRLAELFWELSYQRLVEGDMKRYACQQAAGHARAALALDPTDGGLWYLVLRVAIEIRETRQAREAVDRARSLGFPEEQLAPYAAELAFLLRDHPAIVRCMEGIGDLSLPAHLARVRQFWTTPT